MLSSVCVTKKSMNVFADMINVQAVENTTHSKEILEGHADKQTCYERPSRVVAEF